MSSYKREYELDFRPTGSSGSALGIGGGLKFSQTADRVGLMMDFDITKTDTTNNNQAVIGITNPSRDTIAALQKEGTINLKVGYKGDIATILVGQKESVTYQDNGGDKRIEISVLEGSASYKQSNISMNYSFGATNLQIINDLVLHLIDKVPSIDSANPFIILSLEAYQFPQVVVGDAFKLLEQFLEPIGYMYFINKGVLNILQKQSFLKDLPVLINSFNGMIGSPKPIMESDSNKESLSGIEVMSILNYNFDVGRLVLVNSKQTNGLFKIKTVNFQGNSFEGNWIANIKAYEANGI